MKRTLLKFMLLAAAASGALFGASSASAAYPDVILGDHPVAYYRMEELTNATVTIDSTTNGLNGTIDYDQDTNGVNDYPELGLPGIDTNSYFFKTYTDASQLFHSSEVDIPFNQIFAPVGSDGMTGTAFSAECWVQPAAQIAANNYTVPLADFGPYIGSTGPYANASGWNFYQQGGATNIWVLNMRNVIFDQVSSVPIQLLQWYHLAITFDGSVATFYINGVNEGAYLGGGYVANSGSDITIGAGPPTGQPAFTGGIDEVAFYTNCLTAAQVLNHYQVGTNSFRAVPTAASVLTDPASLTVYSGTTATFSATGAGTAPIFYQWYRGATAISGATNSSYSLTAEYPADNNAMFDVVVTNAYGSATSAVATLTVETNLIDLADPVSVTRTTNSWTAFRVAATGAVPIQYQWYNVDSTPVLIPGATNATYWLHASINAAFDCVFSNPFVTNTSAAATLYVNPRTEEPALTNDLYYKIVMADQPVSYWRLDELNADGGTAVDAAGSFDGTYNDQGGTFTFGAVGQPHTPDAAVTLTNDAVVDFPYALELNPDATWSAEMWLNPSSLGANPNDYRVVLSSEYNVYPNPYNGWYIYQRPSNDFTFVPQPGGGFLSATPDDPANNNQIVVGKWYHLVVTDDGTAFNVYVNGELRLTDPLTDPYAQYIPNGLGYSPYTQGQNTVIGMRTDGAFGGFDGTVDETAFYNYALTPQQVASHYNASVKLTIVPALSAHQAVLSWPVGTLQSSTNAASGYTTVVGATSPYTNTVSGTVFFRVKAQ
jgi:hypothetical protein